MTNKVALVTGSNKGIGYAIVEELLRRGVGTVYLTSRSKQRGREAVAKLKADGANPEYHQLDVIDDESVKICAEFIKTKNGGLDILINNAGIPTEYFTNITYDDAKSVLNTNYTGVLRVEKYFFPILNENARVINISSNCGHISNLRNEEWITRLTKDNITKTDMDAFVNWFLDSIRMGTWKPEDFTSSMILSYTVSKVALSALTRAQQRNVDRNISVNSIHPGFVKTGMTDWAGIMNAKQASKAPVFLALDADQSVKGRYFWFDKTEKGWDDPTLLQ